MWEQEIFSKCPNTWSARSYKGHNFVQLTPGTSEFDNIKRIIGSSFVISKIVRIENPYLYARYTLKLLECKSRSGGAVTEKQLIHCTNEANAQRIAKGNLDWRLARRCKFGQGVSFSPCPDYANKYSGNKGALIVAKVIIGRSSCGSNTTILPGSEFFDTTTGNGGKVYVKYYDDEFYPEYIAHYNEVQMEAADLINHFRCNSCNRYLIPPIIQCVQGHILCCYCFKTKTDKCHRCNDRLSTVVHKIFGQLAKRSFFPCSFAENGCDVKFKWTDIEKHEKQCHFQNFECPLLSVENCKWRGPNTNLENHFYETHQDSLLIAVDDAVTVKFDDLKDIQKVFLIIAQNTTFLCYLIPSCTPGLEDVAVHLAGTENDFEQYRFELKLNITKTGENSVIFSGVVHPNRTDDLKTFEGNLLLCNLCFPTYKCQIKIINSLQENVSDSFVLDQITCYQCKTYATPPIFSCRCHTWCKNCKTTVYCGCLAKIKCYRCEKVFETSMYKCKINHNICDDCINSFNRCCCGNIIIGKSSKGIIRNYQLEPLFDRAIAPCAFASVGCTKTFKVKKRFDHVCKFGHCVQCSWKGKLPDLLLHAKEEHELITNGMFEILDGENLVQRTIGVNGKAFVLHCIKDSKSNFRHFVVQAYANYSQYKYTITIGNGNEFINGTQMCTSITVSYQEVIHSGKALTFPEFKIMSSIKKTIFVERITAE